jgi:hypothetical protein
MRQVTVHRRAGRQACVPPERHRQPGGII